MAETIEELRKKGLVFQGRLEKPKGHDDGDWEDREQTLFRSTDFGDDVDRALMKSDGSYTYFAADMAYHHNKLARGFKHLINVFGADHAGYLTRVKAAVAALSDGKADLDIKVCQLVRLLRAGEPLVMSKRAGTFVTLREVVDEVGRGSRALHDALPQERCAARFRSGQGAWSNPRTIRSSTCSTRMRGRSRCSAWPRRLSPSFQPTRS